MTSEVPASAVPAEGVEANEEDAPLSPEQVLLKTYLNRKSGDDNEEDDDSDDGFERKDTTNTEIMTALTNGDPTDLTAKKFEGLGQRSGSILKLPVHSMTVASIVALYQTHEEEGLLHEDVAQKEILHGANLIFGEQASSCCFGAPKKGPVTVTATVIRQSKIFQLDVTKLVPGDLLVLKKGTCPADARLVTVSEDCKIDNSQCNPGFPEPFHPTTAADLEQKEPNKAKNMVFGAITEIISGSATAIVTHTGNSTWVYTSGGKTKVGKKKSCTIL